MVASDGAGAAQCAAKDLCSDRSVAKEVRRREEGTTTMTDMVRKMDKSGLARLLCGKGLAPQPD